MAASRPPGGIEDAEERDTVNNKRGKRGQARGTVGESPLMDRALAAATGAPGKGKGKGAGLNVKGASGTLVEVRNLTKGTSAEDVQVCASILVSFSPAVLTTLLGHLLRLWDHHLLE